MDTPDVYPDVLGDALSYSSQRLAQLGSLVTAAAVVEAQRRAQANAARAARDDQALTALHDQERAAWHLARARWAPAHDSRWLAQADLLQAVRVWSAAAGYADADPTAGSATRKCEERLRALHPYAMAWYDRLRSEGAGAFDAMRQALPLFTRAPYARPGDPAGQRRALDYSAASRDADADGGVRLPGAGSRPDLKAEQRGRRIAGRLQARALAERGYAHPVDHGMGSRGQILVRAVSIVPWSAKGTNGTGKGDVWPSCLRPGRQMIGDRRAIWPSPGDGRG
jgi:hypothetical protein